MNWSGVANRITELTYKWGMDYNTQRKMINPLLCFIYNKVVADITVFGEWMERKYPAYKNKSVKDFLKENDPDNFDEWVTIFGLDDSTYSNPTDSEVNNSDLESSENKDVIDVENNVIDTSKHVVDEVPKKKRGRPKKVVENKEVSENKENILDSSEQVPKKKRGRPRKHPVETSTYVELPF